jgi:flavin-dependent dehydrogenase
VDRAHFDLLLLDAAHEAGAQVLQRARVSSVGRGCKVRASDAEGPISIEARCLVDATGRSCLTGGTRLMHSGPLLALWAYWRQPAGFGVETRVESGTAAWYWGAPLPGGTVNCTVVFDPAEYKEPRERLYEALMAQSVLLRACLGEERRSAIRVCDATPYRSKEIIAGNLVKVGEAALRWIRCRRSACRPQWARGCTRRQRFTPS